MATRRDVRVPRDEELVELFERELEGAPEGGGRAFVATGKRTEIGRAGRWPEPYCASGKMHQASSF